MLCVCVCVFLSRPECTNKERFLRCIIYKTSGFGYKKLTLNNVYNLYKDHFKRNMDLYACMCIRYFLEPINAILFMMVILRDEGGVGKGHLKFSIV